MIVKLKTLSPRPSALLSSPLESPESVQEVSISPNKDVEGPFSPAEPNQPKPDIPLDAEISAAVIQEKVSKRIDKTVIESNRREISNYKSDFSITCRRIQKKLSGMKLVTKKMSESFESCKPPRFKQLRRKLLKMKSSAEISAEETKTEIIDKIEEVAEEEEMSVKGQAFALTSGAPTSAKPNQNQIKRTKSWENKHKCSITSERLFELKQIAKRAANDHKTFTIVGEWPVIRRELLKRGWVEKFQENRKSSTSVKQRDFLTGLPVKKNGEAHSNYVDRCEKALISRMLQDKDVDFYWNSRLDPEDMRHRHDAHKTMNHFVRTPFTSKEGLTLLLQDTQWFIEPGVSSMNFPRSYVIYLPEHFASFLEDFRLTAAVGLLKYLVCDFERVEEGRVPVSCIKFALDRCCDFLSIQDHCDIDRSYPRSSSYDWNQFLVHYYEAVHENRGFKVNQQFGDLYQSSRYVLDRIRERWLDFDNDGVKNVWILKPGNNCRGNGIELVKFMSEIREIKRTRLRYVIQKYIERPLLVKGKKFDIRQWFLVSNVLPLNIWIYKECYLRFSSEAYTLDNFHESIHLTNYSVQCRYTKNNMCDLQEFRDHLKSIGQEDKWGDIIAPAIRECIICTILASQESMDRRPNTFELYGADFMISEDYRPWLIEINSNPDLSYSTSITKRMCPECMKDLLKVVIDRRRNPQADTGGFELIFRQNLPSIPLYLGMKFSIKGKKCNVFRIKAIRRVEIQAKDDPKLQEEIEAATDFVQSLNPKKSWKRKLSKITQTPFSLFRNFLGEDLVADDFRKPLRRSVGVNCEASKRKKNGRSR